MKMNMSGEKLVKRKQPLENNFMTKRSKKLLRITRHKRIRKKLFGTAEMPRLSVFRSNKHIYAQLINDNDGHTITSANDSKLTAKNNIQKAEGVGVSIAKNAKEIGVTKIVFDKSGYKYTGRIQALAEAMRKEGLDF